MKQILHIFKYKLLIFIRLNTKIDLQSLLKNIGSSIIYISFALGAFWFAQKFINFLLVEIKIGRFLLHEFISTVLFIFFLSVNVGNIIVSYSTLYKSPEAGFLFTKPVKPSNVFAIKFLDNFFYSSSTLLLMLISLLAGYAAYFKLSVLSFLYLLVFNFFPFIFSAGSLGVIVLLIIIKLASKFGVKRIVYGVVVTYLAIVFFFFKINSPKNLVQSVMNLYPLIDKDKYLAEFISPLIKLLPNSWLSETAFWISQNNITNTIAPAIMQITLSIALFMVALRLGSNWYFDTWLKNIKLSAVNSNNRKISTNLFSFQNILLNEKKQILEPQTESLIKKDFHLFMREPAQVIHFLILFFLILIFVSSVSGIKYVGLGNFYLQTGIYLAVFLFNLLLVSTLSLRFIFPLISLEGLTFWKIRSAPVENKNLVKLKFFTFGGVIFVIGVLLNYFANYRFVFIVEIMSLVIISFAVVTIIAINFGMGGLFANYKEKNAIRLSSSQGASIAFLFNIIYMLFIVVLLFDPMSSYFLAIMIRKDFQLFRLLYPVIPIALLSIMLIIIFVRAGINSLKKDFL